MEKLNKADIPQEAFDLYDYYCHNKLDRRTFIEKLSVYAVGGITVAALLGSMMPDYDSGRTVALGDERLQSSDYLMYPLPKVEDKSKPCYQHLPEKENFPAS